MSHLLPHSPCNSFGLALPLPLVKRTGHNRFTFGFFNVAAVFVFVFWMRVFFTLFQRCMFYLPSLLRFSSTPSGKCYPFLSPRFPFKLQALLFLGPAFPTPSLMPPLIGAAEWGFLYTMCNNAAKMQDGAGMGMVRVLKRVSFCFASSTSFPPGHLLATLCETLFSSTLSTRLLMFLFPFPF